MEGAADKATDSTRMFANKKRSVFARTGRIHVRNSGVVAVARLLDGRFGNQFIIRFTCVLRLCI